MSVVKIREPLEVSTEWECQLFGAGLVLTPLKDSVPNLFWRKMQYLMVGNKWVRKV